MKKKKLLAVTFLATITTFFVFKLRKSKKPKDFIEGAYA